MAMLVVSFLQNQFIRLAIYMIENIHAMMLVITVHFSVRNTKKLNTKNGCCTYRSIHFLLE